MQFPKRQLPKFVLAAALDPKPVLAAVYIKEGRWGREAVSIKFLTPFVCIKEKLLRRRGDELWGLKDGGENSWYERRKGKQFV